VGEPLAPLESLRRGHAGALCLRPTVVGGDTLQNDYRVIRDVGVSAAFGRRLSALGITPAGTGQLTRRSRSPAWGHGSAASLPAAKQAFREAWDRFYASLTPADIKYWHDIADAAASRYPTQEKGRG
jgi:hypothetical protein